MSINTTWTATWILVNTFTADLWLKSISSVCILLLQTIIVWNELLISFVVIFWAIDFILWLTIALRDKIFSVTKFMKWAYNLWMYAVLIVLWTGLDIWLIPIFSTIMYWFILSTIWIHILRKSDKLWFPTPMFIEKYLISYKKKLDGKLNWNK